MIEEGVKVKFKCGHEEVWLKSQFYGELGQEKICRSCDREVIFVDGNEQPVKELWHWSEIVGLERVKIITEMKIEPWV